MTGIPKEGICIYDTKDLDRWVETCKIERYGEDLIGAFHYFITNLRIYDEIDQPASINDFSRLWNLFLDSIKLDVKFICGNGPY